MQIGKTTEPHVVDDLELGAKQNRIFVSIYDNAISVTNQGISEKLSYGFVTTNREELYANKLEDRSDSTFRFSCKRSIS